MNRLFFTISLFCVIFTFFSCESSGISEIRSNILQTAEDQLGVPYLYGGETPSYGFDCSGLIYYCYKEHGIEIPRVSKSQYENGEQLSLEDAQPADIVAFHSPVSHVGIYTSEEEFIHAPLPGYSVRISSLIGYWGEHLTGVACYIED